jgi:hypothetical protein
MDPDACLADILSFARGLADGPPDESQDTLSDFACNAQQMAAMILDLDTWIHDSHGYLPDRWTKFGKLNGRDR